MITIDSLQFTWGSGDFSLCVPELQIKPQASTAIIGASGSGKSTLLQLIAGIMRPIQGRITIDSVDITQLTEVQRRAFRIQHIGLVFQDFQLIPYLNVLENVLLPARINPALPLTTAVRTQALTLLEQAGMLALQRRSVQRLSQGERQRVAICRALLASPSLILADEPTGNLDPANSSRLLDLFFEQVQQRQATLVMVTHDHSILDRFDHVLPLDEILQTAVAAATSDQLRMARETRP
ncbi:MAG: ABC transporter ATP-binding protein [Planctomycetaceae bacterium]|nr:ABC transporter ATP-binding protein [Planctomycetaceae bacterium]